ncbi:MAG: acyl carrier protein [Alphaproteobacteria bacterium]|nr:acyl carrier protein [Alphaproteobacteria bacterium]
MQRVREVIVEATRLRLAPEAIDPDVHLFGAGLGLDSIDALELVLALERAFHTRLVERTEPAAVVLRSANGVVDRLLELGAA